MISKTGLQKEKLYQSICQLDADQLKTYNVLMKCLNEPKKRQIVMFISGESGTGKSRLARVIAEGAQYLFDKPIESINEQYGPVMCTAPSAHGAFKIGGFVWQHLLLKTLRYYPKELSPAVIKQLQDRFQGVEMFILDDLSMVSLEDLYEIHFRLCTATGDFTHPFGGLHVVLLGDFYQLKTVTGTPIVRTDYGMANSRALQGRALFKDEMTHYGCLTHNHRANGLSRPLAAFISAARLGEVSPLALEELNAKVVDESMNDTLLSAHPKTMWITDSHVKVNQINKLFLENKQDQGAEMIRLVAHHTSSIGSGSGYLDMATRNSLYSINGGLNNDGCRRPFIAPLVIDICIGSRIRLTANIMPRAGLFHGAMGTVVGVVYRGDGQKTSLLSCLTNGEHELPIVLVRMDGYDDRYHPSCSHTLSRVVPIVPIASPQRIALDGRRFTRYQVPIALAHARTAFALCGYSPPHGIVSDVSGAFFGSQYVALSCIASDRELKLLAPLKMSYFDGHLDYRQFVNAEYNRLITAFDLHTLRRKN
jgi:hypothetical protein